MTEESFAAVAEAARSARAVRRDISRLRRSVLAAMRSAPDVVPWFRELPRLELPVSDPGAAMAVLDGLTTNQPWPMRYRAVGVIALPSSFEEYLRGRSMQATRTNRTRARARGLSVIRSESVAHSRRLLAALLESHAVYATVADALRAHVVDERKQVWFVRDAGDTPVGVAVVAVDRGVAQLATLQIAVDISERSEARYLLSTELVRGLIAESRDHLVADSMLLAEPGVVYLQRRLGFVPMRIVVSRWLRLRRAVRNLRSASVPALDPADSAASDPVLELRLGVADRM